MKHCMLVVVTVLLMVGCSREIPGPRIEYRAGKTSEAAELDERVLVLERIVEAREQEKTSEAFAKDTGISVIYLPRTQWSKGCLSMSRKGSKRSYYFCGSRLIETTEDEIRSMNYPLFQPRPD